MVFCREISFQVGRVALWSAVYVHDRAGRGEGCAPNTFSGESPFRRNPPPSDFQAAERAAEDEAVGQVEEERVEGSSQGQRQDTRREAARSSPNVRRQSPSTGSLVRIDSQIRNVESLLKEVWADDSLAMTMPAPPPFAKYVGEQSSRVLLVPVLARAAGDEERVLLRRRLGALSEFRQAVAAAEHKRRLKGKAPSRAPQARAWWLAGGRCSEWQVPLPPHVL